MKSRSVPAALLLVLGLVAAGCGGSDEPDGDAGGDGGGGDAITVVATEYAFDPPDVSIEADTATTIALDNQGIIEHDWTIDELDVHIVTNAGETAEATLTAAAGTYEVYCSVPGHRDQGMEGVVTVG